MVVVAVAGGTGGVGKTIVEALKSDGKHEVKILSRKANPAFEEETGFPVLAVDYSDVEALTKILEDNNIHTIISALVMVTFDNSTPGEFGLIQAADASKTTERFITSDWGGPFGQEQAAVFPGAANKLKAQAQLRETDLEWTAVYNGYFLDYFSMPGVKSNMTNVTMVLDIARNAAAIPGSGNVPVAFTHTSDVAKFAVASLGLPKWDEATNIVADRLTWNEFLRLAEEVKGVKFKVAHDSVEDLKSGKATELPSQVDLYPFFPKPMLQQFACMFGLWFEEGVFNFETPKLLNDQFPNIKPWTAKAILQAAWGKKA